MSKPMLVLASGSPRRRQLVGLLGLTARLSPQDLDEESLMLAEPAAGAMNLALQKARSAVKQIADDELVLGADTIVVSDGRILGKPANEEAAWQTLRSLRDRAHEVITGVAIRLANGREWGAFVSTRVVMRNYTDAEIGAYIARGEPFDKAGGYATQDVAFHPTERFEGCYLNVVGLPLCAVDRGLATLGVTLDSTSDSFVPPCSYCERGEPLVRI